MSLLDRMRQDTTDYLDEQGETLTLKRKTVVYGTGDKYTETWSTVGTFVGDWQQVSGDTVRREVGLAVKSTSEIFVEYDTEALAGDRVYRADGSYEEINYIQKWQDHAVLMTRVTEGES